MHSFCLFLITPRLPASTWTFGMGILNYSFFTAILELLVSGSCYLLSCGGLAGKVNLFAKYTLGVWFLSFILVF